MERLPRPPAVCRAAVARIGGLMALLVCLGSPFDAWANTAPTITKPADATVSQATSTGALAFTIDDAEDAESDLVLSKGSSDETLIPLGNIVFGGSGASRTVTVTPAAGLSGSATITVTVTDTDSTPLSASASFVVTVNDPPTISNITNKTIDEDHSTGAVAFTVGDTETAAGSLVVTATSSSANLNLLPTGSIVLGGSGEDRTLTITPAANENGTATITVTVTDAGGRTDSDSFTLTVDPINDRPTISGTLLGTISSPVLDTSSDVLLFSGITLGDVDQGRPGTENLTVTITQDASTLVLGSFDGYDTGNIVLTGTPDSVTSQIQALKFDPAPNRAPVGESASFTVTISVVDGAGSTATNNGEVRPVYVESANDNPTIAGSLSPSTVSDSGTSTPFRLSISDVDPGDEALAFTVALEPVSDPGFTYGSFVPASPSFTGSLADAVFWVQGIAFQPVANSVAGTQTITVRFRVTDVHGGVATDEVTLSLTGQNDPPQIVGVSPNVLRITDDPSQPAFYPFAQVRISDPDQNGSQSQTVTLSVSDSALGSLSSTTLTGTPSEVTDLLRLITFTPAVRTDRVLGETVNATLTIRVVDALGVTRENAQTSLAITAVNGAPVIGGLPATPPLEVSPLPPVRPFAGLTVTDDDTTSDLTFSISLKDENLLKGFLTNLVGVGGSFVEEPAGSGIYEMVGAPSDVTEVLTNLHFVVSSTYVFPPSAPGGTTFTLKAVDASLNTTEVTLDIVLQNEPRNHLVISDGDEVYPEDYATVEERGRPMLGTLRRAVEEAGNNDVITFALPAYPALIRLDSALGPIELPRNVTLKGPGADLLTISGDSRGDRNRATRTRIFTVLAQTTIEGLTIADGYAVSGGAIAVGPSARLRLRYCAVIDSLAVQWGGGIDVDGGSLEAENCLFRGNETDSSLGLGGGAVSLFTTQSNLVRNSTFSANLQAAANGFGGGALYAEVSDPSAFLAVEVTHCTFAENHDVAGRGSSIAANVLNTVVTVGNSIVADGRGRNLEVQGAGRIVSAGGNLSDDSTRAILTQGGVPKLIILFDRTSDHTAVNPLLGAYDERVLKPVGGYPLLAGSPAIGHGLNPAPAIDQRGALRDIAPDAGALELGASARVVLNEIQHQGATTDFLEFYVLRDSVPFDLSGFTVWVDGSKRHVITDGTIVRPGFGLVLADTVLAAGTGAAVQTPTGGDGPLLELGARGTVEVRTPGTSGRVVVSAGYVGVYADPEAPDLDLSTGADSITLAPQFRGFAYVPHSFVLDPPTGGVDPTVPAGTDPESPGADSGGTPFGSPNAFPSAVADAFVVGEDELLSIPVLDNDSDADGSDHLVIVDLSVNAGEYGNDASVTTANNTLISVVPAGSPVAGTSILYDPTASLLQSLPEGIERTEQFYYSVVDVGTGVISEYQSDSGDPGITVILSANHRLLTGQSVVISGAGVAAYNGVHAVKRLDADRFSVGVPFASDPVDKGDWETVLDLTGGAITGYASGSAGDGVLVTSAGHGLQDNDGVVISGAGLDTYNGLHLVKVIDNDTFEIAVTFVSDPSTRGSWAATRSRIPTRVSQAAVTMTVIGANDPPSPTDDTVAGEEETVTRIFGDGAIPGGLGTPDFDTDDEYPMKPVFAAVSLLANDGTSAGNDGDIDADDDRTTLHIVGVLSEVFPIAGFSGTTGTVGTVVSNTLPHQLASGDVVLISGYGGHPSYNGFHEVTVIDDHLFSIPVIFVDNAATSGSWAILTDANRLQAVSEHGAAVRLEIRVDRIETSIVYNPLESEYLNGLADGESEIDTFYYAVEDSHGAVSFAAVHLNVAGRNDPPEPGIDPPGLADLPPDVDPEILLGDGTVDFYLPPGSGLPGRADAEITVGTDPDVFTLFITNIWFTDEETSLSIDFADLLANDTDIDRSDVSSSRLRVDRLADSTSRLGASLTFDGSGGRVIYGPSPALNALAREEAVIDTFHVVISDGHSDVDALVAVLVVGLNDKPTAFDDAATTTEDEVVTVVPLENDTDPDVNGVPPDNVLRILPQPPSITANGATVTLTISNLVYDPTASAYYNAFTTGYSETEEVPYTVADSSLIFANDDRYKVQADGSDFSLDLLVNDRNLTGSGGELRIVSVGTPNKGGSVSINAAGDGVAYTPQVNYVGEEVFPYTVSDENGNTDRAFVVIRATVNQLNGNLQANDDAFSVAFGETATLDVLANDNILPASGSALTITRIVTPPAQDEVEIVDNQVLYHQTSLTAGYTVSFSYEVSGGGTALAVATAEVQVVDRRGTLEVRTDAFSVAADTADQPLDVLANDSILPGTPVVLSVARVTDPPKHGTYTIADDGSQILYTPNPGFVGKDDLSYEAIDGFGGTGITNVFLAVGALTTSPDFYAVPFDGVDTELDVLANDRVLEASPETVEIIAVGSLPTTLGTLSIAGDGRTLRFTSSMDQEGEATVSYTIRDGTAAGRTANGSLTVVVIREGVRSNADFFSVDVGSAENVLSVLSNDAAIPDRGRRLSVVSLGTGVNGPNRGGAVRISEAGDSLIYTPAPGFSGEETFTYTMTDSRATDTSKVVVRVASGVLSANDDAFTVFYAETSGGGPVSFTLSVLANDRVSPDAGQVLAVTGVGIDDLINDPNAPDRDGLVEVSADGTSLIYTPTQTTGFPYVEHFTYEINDGTARRAEGKVSIEVQKRDDVRDMETHDDAFTVERDSVANVLPVLANDDVRPASAAGWSISNVGPASHGGVLTVRGTAVVYTPQPGFIGTETFPYSVSDGVGGTGSATVSVKVGDLPLCPDVFTVLSGTANNALDVLANDAIRPDETDASYHLSAISSVPAKGTAVISDGVVLYTPTGPGPYPYADTFWYEVEDDSGLVVSAPVTVQVYEAGSDRDSAVVEVTVVGVNDAPLLTGTRCCFEVYQHGSVQPFAGVTITEFDTIPAPEVLTLVIQVSDPAHGYLTDGTGADLDPDHDGQYTFTGTAEELTNLLRSLVFVPTVGDPSRLEAGGSEETRLTLTLSDSEVTIVDDTTTIITRHPEVSRLQAADGSSSDEFGFSVGASRTVVTSGAPFDDDAAISGSGNKTGSAYVFEVNTPVPGAWGQTAKVVANARGIGDEFGYSTDVNEDGNVLAVGARRAKTGSSTTGAAYIFRRAADDSGAWVEVARLSAPSLSSSDNYGWDIALNPAGDLAVVGAPNHAPPSSARTGAAFVFARTAVEPETWEYVAMLKPGDGARDDEFGRTVSVNGNLIAVGSPRHVPTSKKSGAAYLFWRGASGAGAWTQLAKVKPAAGDKDDEFGHSVAVHGNWLAVGARLDEANGKKSGTTYVFQQSASNPATWTQTAMLQSAAPGNDDEYGFAVGLDGQFLVVGARRESVAGRRAGALYVHGRDQGGPGAWGLLERLIPSTVDLDDEFGFSVAIRQGLAAVGARRQQADGKRFGATYVYQLRFNNAPLVRGSVPAVTNLVEEPFAFDFPISLFADGDVGDSIVGYQAALADGQSLPSWMRFDGATGRFTWEGVPPAEVIVPTTFDVGSWTVRVSALDQDGASASIDFDVVIEVGSAFLASAVPRPSVALAWSLEHAQAIQIPAASASLTYLGAAEDPDGDGQNNLEEYARASDPFSAEGEGEAGRLSVERDAQAGSVRLRLRRRTDDPRLVYHLETSADFHTWRPIHGARSRATQRVSDRIDEASYDLPAEAASQATFFRIRVDYR